MAVDRKGKGKAIDNALSDTDSDSSDNFFIMKPRAIRSFPKIPPTEKAIEISDDEDDYDDDGIKIKKKKKRYKKQPSHGLPDWARGAMAAEKEPTKKRGSTEDRQTKETSEIHIISSEENSPKRLKGKEREASSRTRITLTPPPAITDAERAKWREASRKTLPVTTGPITIDEDEDGPVALSSSPLPANSEKIYVNVSMMTDRDNIPEGASERAIKHWETRRRVYIFRDGKLDMMWYAIGQSWNRNPDDIILCHAGHRIYSKLRTARELGIDEGADITGYERTHWDRLEKEKQREIERITKGEYVPSPEKEGTAIAPPGEESVKKIKISLRGEWGVRKIAAPVILTGADLARIYCTKSGKPEDLASQLRLEFDGEVIENDVKPFEEMDMDDGDMIDVTVPKE